MATHNELALNKRHLMQAAYGNLSVAYAKVSLPIGAAANDTADFIRIPKNVRILDFVECHDGANTATGTTGNFGLAAVPGGSSAQADADYFLAAADLSAAGRNRWGNTAVAPIVTDSDYYLRLVVGGTTTTGAAMDVHVTLYYEFLGNL